MTGASSKMTNAVTIGAGPWDTIRSLQVSNPAIPVGGKTVNPVQFTVLAANGTYVAGASVALSTTNGMTLDLCGGGTSCTVLSDESGIVMTNVGITAAGSGVLTAQLAPRSYANPSTARATLHGISSSLGLALLHERTEVEQGAMVDVPLLARVLNAASPQPGVVVNFHVAGGLGR